jgi:magnesium-transporting ATPase (P-type)
MECFFIKESVLLILKGAPLRKIGSQEEWSSIHTPNFPIAFSIVSGFFLYLPGLIKGIPRNQSFNLQHFIIASLIATITGAIICILLNLLMKASYKVILKRFINPNQDAKIGSRRVLYFSSFYQIVMFFVFSILYLLQIFYNQPKINIYSIILLPLVIIVRLLSVFQATRHETNNSYLAGLLAILPCLDVWGIILFYIV